MRERERGRKWGGIGLSGEESTCIHDYTVHVQVYTQTIQLHVHACMYMNNHVYRNTFQI